MNWNLVEELGDIRKKIEALHIPAAVYSSVQIGKSHAHIAERGEPIDAEHCYKIQNSYHDTAKVPSWLKKNAALEKVKYIAAGITGDGNLLPLASNLWLEEDIVPLLFPKVLRRTAVCPTCGMEDCTMALAQEAAAFFDKNNIPLVKLGRANEVQTANLATFEEYRKKSEKKDIEKLLSLAEKFKGKKIRFFSATPRGGGVAIMRHALMRLFRLLKVDAHWHVMQERTEVFEITKTKFHNLLQGVSDSKMKLTLRDKKIYNTWIKENAALFDDVFKDAEVIIIDDPQPAGLIPYVRKANPKAKIIYRSHIHIETELVEEEGSAQSITWQFLWQFIKESDYFISHPIKTFVPRNVPKKKVFFMPATTDLFDGLNKSLSERDKKYYLLLFNKLLLEAGQVPLDPRRPYIIQIARFDPSKGIQDAADAYIKVYKRLTREKKPLPQLVLVGHASIDDPDGTLVNNLVLKMLSKKGYSKFTDEIKVVRLQNIDQLLNTLLCQSKIVLQLSHKEGFEIKVTEALMKGKPVISYKAGGIPLQIKHGKTGFIVAPIGATTIVANYLYKLLTDDKLYQAMSLAAMRYWRRDLTTVSNATNWLYLSNMLSEKSKIKRGGGNIEGLLREGM